MIVANTEHMCAVVAGYFFASKNIDSTFMLMALRSITLHTQEQLIKRSHPLFHSIFFFILILIFRRTF